MSYLARSKKKTQNSKNHQNERAHCCRNDIHHLHHVWVRTSGISISSCLLSRNPPLNMARKCSHLTARNARWAWIGRFSTKNVTSLKSELLISLRRSPRNELLVTVVRATASGSVNAAVCSLYDATRTTCRCCRGSTTLGTVTFTVPPCPSFPWSPFPHVNTSP